MRDLAFSDVRIFWETYSHYSMPPVPISRRKIFRYASSKCDVGIDNDRCKGLERLASLEHCQQSLQRGQMSRIRVSKEGRGSISLRWISIRYSFETKQRIPMCHTELYQETSTCLPIELELVPMLMDLLLFFSPSDVDIHPVRREAYVGTTIAVRNSQLLDRNQNHL